MSVPKGSAEQAIREATIAKLRDWYPNARIVHELNVDGGDTRADLAAITPDTLILVELKSQADTLERLNEQVRRFARCAHQVIVCTHTRFDYNDVRRAAAESIPFWRYDGTNVDTSWYQPYEYRRHPWSLAMLELLWADELRALCGALQVSVGKREARRPMINEIIRLCRAPEIEEGVCRALRRRKFVTADEVATAKAAHSDTPANPLT